MSSYRSTLVPPFMVRSQAELPHRKVTVTRRESGPLSLKDAYQVMLRRKRECDKVWVEDNYARVVDFDRLNAEGVQE